MIEHIHYLTTCENKGLNNALKHFESPHATQRH